MERVEVSDEMMARFAVTHGQPTNTRTRGQNRQWALTASRAVPARSVRVSYDDWAGIVRLVERHGYRCPSDNLGLSGDHTLLFANALSRGIDAEESTDPLRGAAARVLDFVRGPGRDGFKMQSQWA
jgi:hypothetical protein